MTQILKESESRDVGVFNPSIDTLKTSKAESGIDGLLGPRSMLNPKIFQPDRGRLEPFGSGSWVLGENVKMQKQAVRLFYGLKKGPKYTLQWLCLFEITNIT